MSSLNLYQYKSVLILSEGNLKIFLLKSKPNIWWRFWHYVFFGWKWEDCEN